MKKLSGHGFTLVELLVVILATGLFVGSAQVLITSHVHLSQRTRDAVSSNAYIESKIESLRSAGFATLNNGTTNVTNELPAELKAPRSGSVVITSQSPAIKRVVVNITYNDQGSPRTYQYTTFIGELGVGQQ